MGVRMASDLGRPQTHTTDQTNQRRQTEAHNSQAEGEEKKSWGEVGAVFAVARKSPSGID